jgi:hypothetical protein
MRRYFIGLAFLVLAACSGADREAQQRAQAQAAAEAAAAKDASAYRELVAAQSWELAQSIGREVVRKYPASAAAAEVKKTLPEVDTKANALVEGRRLAALWAYQSGEQSGGEQHTASMYSLEPSGTQQVRLILRRHADWGQSVYLHGGTQGFTCGKPCTVAVQFDDAAPAKLEASIPEGGEPAVFIEDDKAFLARMDAAQRVTFQVDRKGFGKQKVVFEVGGYDASKWVQLSK